MLLQLDEYANGKEYADLGAGGSLYVMIRERDLKKQKFATCDFDRQFM